MGNIEDRLDFEDMCKIEDMGNILKTEKLFESHHLALC